MTNRKVKKIIVLFLFLSFITACSQQKKNQSTSHSESEKAESQINPDKDELTASSVVSEDILLKIIKKEIPVNDYLNKKVSFKAIAMSESLNRNSIDGKRYIQVYIKSMAYFLLVKTEEIDEKFQSKDNITVVGTIKEFKSAENDLGQTEVLIIEPDYLEDSNGNQYKHN